MTNVGLYVNTTPMVEYIMIYGYNIAQNDCDTYSYNDNYVYS